MRVYGLRLSIGLIFASMLALSPAWAQDSAPAPAAASSPHPNAIVVDPDGTLHIPAQTIPMSSLMSPELKASLMFYLTHAKDPKYSTPGPDGSKLIHKAERDAQDALYPVNKDDTTVGGVHVIVFTPKGGVSAKNKHRVLIELHSADCWIDCAILGSQPITYLGKIKVIAVDYQEPQFPTAVGQVESVYRELLKTYKPQNIGIYGCSRGGIVVSRSLAWFQKQKLPTPGAAGILCASADGVAKGDSTFTGAALGNGVITKVSATPPVDRDLGDIDPNDPLAAPINSPAVLSKFPPTLMIAGTRGVELSTAAYTHEALVRLGVESDLHVFEGGRHAFWFDPVPPESKQIYDIIVKYFDRHLGRHS
jgi:hypothetical protein